MSILVQQSQTLCFGLTEPIVTQCIGDVVPPPKPANALTDRFIMTGDSLRRPHHTYRVTLDAQHPTRTAHIPRSPSRTASTRDAPRAHDVHPFLRARPRAQHAICGTMRRFNAFRAVVPQQCVPTAEANVFNPYRGQYACLKNRGNKPFLTHGRNRPPSALRYDTRKTRDFAHRTAPSCTQHAKKSLLRISYRSHMPRMHHEHHPPQLPAT